MHRIVLASLIAVSIVGCSSPGGSSSDGGVRPPHDAGPRADAGPRPDAGPLALGGWFRHGENAGYYGPGIDDSESASMAVAAGCDSNRVSLPETFLAQWGDDIEQHDFDTYASLGMDHLIVFLTSPTPEHSTAPAGTPDWELAHYAPRNLYEPIFLEDGSVNPENYWAAYVARVATAYGDQLDGYEVWNEPDQVGGNWRATQAWDESPPVPSDLVWWNDTIFSYIRMLRVTYEVVHHIDPSAAVMPGGIGYPNYLSLLLRYSDEPTSGAIDADHPETGAAYMDVLSYHYYPVFAPGNSDVGADGLLAARDHYDAVFAAAGIAPLPYVVTETGAPRRAFDPAPGGAEYARNYVIKVMTLGQAGGLLGIDWFALGEGATLDAATDSFDVMGLYANYSSATMPSETSMTDTGVAYATLGAHLHGARHDPTRSAALPDDAEGVAFVGEDGHEVLVLWARAADGEGAHLTTSVTTDHAFAVHAWDHSQTGTETMLTPEDGAVSVELTSSPVFLVAR